MANMDLDEAIIEESKAVRMSQSSAVRQRVADLILSKPDEKITSLLLRRARGPSPWQEVLDYVRALFHGLGYLAKEDDSSRPAKLLLSLFLHVIDLIHEQSATGDMKLASCVSFLTQELEDFPKTLLPSIANKILSQLESGSFQEGAQTDEDSIHYLLEFLPRCLSLVASAGSVLVPGEDGEGVQTTGTQYRESALKRLLATHWSKTFVTKMAGLLRDLSLGTSEMEQFVRKLFLHMKDAELQDLPSLVYQLLLLASKGFKRVVLTGLINFFNKKHSLENTQKGRASSVQAAILKSSMDAFRQMEGTIVLHINFAVKQDPALGQEWLYLVRTNSWPLTPFLVSVLLSIGRIQRFEQPAFDLLRVAAVKCFKDCQQCRESRWAAAILGALSLQTSKRVEESFMRTVQNRAFGWDHVIPSVVRMGFHLIEASGPGRPKSDVGRPISRVSSTQELGIRVLSAAFEVHEMARDEIIEQSKCRIIGLKPQHSAPILRMVVQLVQNCPQLVLEHSGRLKECLDYFTCLHSISASSLVQAISPLFQLSRDLQDYTVLVLRKAMFGREETARMTAVHGLLDLIISEKRARSSESEPARGRFSEASCSQSSSQFDRIKGGPGSLLQDLLGLLRRGLSQQVSVRETLYKGLPKLLQVDPDASEAVFDLIWPHFNRYYVSEPDNAASLKLDSCVVVQNDAVHVVEPLDHLLHCIHQLLLLRPQVGFGSAHSGTAFGLSESQDHHQELTGLSSGESLAVAFRKIRKTVNKSSLGDFYRDKTLDFSPDNPEGEKNMQLAGLLLGVVEVLIDSAGLDCVNQDSDVRRREAEKELYSYLDLHDSLTQIVNQKQGRSTGKNSEKKDSEKKRRGRPPKGGTGTTEGAETKDPGSEPVGKAVAFSPCRLLLDKRTSFLSRACIVYLLNCYVTQLHSKCSGGGVSQRETSKCNESRIASFALQNYLRHLKATASEPIGQRNTSEANYTDWKLLSMPLFQIVIALRDSSTDAAPGSQDAAKEKGKAARGKKTDTEMGEGLMLTSLKCLDGVLRVASQRSCVAEVVKQMHVDLNDILEDESLESDDEMMSPGEDKENVFQDSEAKIVHHWLTTVSHPLFEELLAHSRYPEVEVLSGIFQNLGSKLPQVLMKKHGTWAHLLCRGKKIRNVGAVRSLANMAMRLSPPPDDIALAQVLGTELLKVMGSDVSEPMDSSDQYPMINKTTRAAVCGLLLHKADPILVDLEWLVSKLKIQASSEVPQLDRKTPLRPGGSQRMLMEETLHKRMETFVLVLSILTTMTLNGVLAEQLLRVTMHFYRCFAAATRLLIAPKGFTQPVPSLLFQSLADLTCKKLTSSVYNFMSSMQRDQQEGPSACKGSVSQIKREGRTIPNLIFHIEESERYLLQLSKVSKINLLKFAKRSTARDFRINDSGKKRKGEAQEDPLNGEEGSGRESDDEGEEGIAPDEEDIPADGEEDDVPAESDDRAAAGEEETRVSGGRPPQSRSRVIHDSDDDSDGVAAPSSPKRQRSQDSG